MRIGYVFDLANRIAWPESRIEQKLSRLLLPRIVSAGTG
jgi:hypothetical protein